MALAIKANELARVLEEAAAGFRNFVQWLQFWNIANTSTQESADAQLLCVTMILYSFFLLIALQPLYDGNRSSHA